MFHITTLVPVLLCLASGPGPAPVVRAEYFEVPAAEGDGPEQLVCLKRLTRPGDEVLEQEVLFAEGGLRILQTESLTLDAPRLVWRELAGPRSPGFTWSAEWSARERALRTTEWGPSDRIHGQAEAPRGCSFPLALLEELRVERIRPGERQLVLPRSGGLVPVRIEVEAGAPGEVLASQGPHSVEPVTPGSTTLRTVTLRTDEGALLAAYVLHGERVLALRWQAGGPWALRVTPEVWAERAAELRALTRPRGRNLR